MHALRRAAALCTGLALGLAIGAGPAAADPAAGTTVNGTDIVGVSPFGLQFVCDQFSTDYDANLAPTHTLPPYDYCWDSTNPSTGLPGGTITTKHDTNCVITRPNGAGADLAALETGAKLTSGTSYCIDIAFSDRPLKAGGDPTGLTQREFGQDLTTYATITGGNGVANLTDTQLKAIYSCNANLLNSGYPAAPVTWTEVGGTSTDPIVPILPMNGSGIRGQWLADIALTTPGSCVVNGTSPVDGSTIEDNEGTNSVFTSSFANVKDDLVPFSGGDYVCYVYTAKCPPLQGNLHLNSIDGKAPLTTGHTINYTVFSPTYLHGLYAVVRTAATSNGIPAYLQTFVYTWLCGTTAAADITNYGFRPLCAAPTGV